MIRLNHSSTKAAPDAPDASILVIRNGVELLTSETNFLQSLYQEQTKLDPDQRARMRGRVVNKIARYNLCFSTVGQSADYEQGKGTIVAWDQVPYTQTLRNRLTETFKTLPLECEGNYYYDTTSPKVGIGFHGDSERRLVIGVRMGTSMPLMYWWFKNFEPVGEPTTILLNHGDIYAMSEKAVGFDWKRSSILTLRHSAGSYSYLENEMKRICKKGGSTPPLQTPFLK